MTNRLVTPAESYDQPRASDEMVWAMCDYVRHNVPDFVTCDRCAKLCEETYDGDPLIRGCYLMAEEASRVAMAALKKFPPPNPTVAYRDDDV
jgi:hypothetical protein